MRYIISYDVSDTRIRSRLSKILEGFGERVQYSVFECNLSRDQYSNLLAKLQAQSLLKERKSCKISLYKVEPHLISKIRRVGAKPLIDQEVILI